MPNQYKTTPPAGNYDARWFVWTIVFLVAAGIGLTSFIMLSDHGTYDVPDLPKTRVTANQ